MLVEVGMFCTGCYVLRGTFTPNYDVNVHAKCHISITRLVTMYPPSILSLSSLFRRLNNGVIEVYY